MSNHEETCVCPWWMSFTLNNLFRRWAQNPEKILGPYLREGMTAADIGCGPGFFTLSMARLVGERGFVIAIDLQQEMLDMLAKKARKAGLDGRIRPHRCEQDRIGVTQEVDFVLTFWMVHEVPDAKGFLGEVFSMVKPGGKYLLAEPTMHHVTPEKFAQTLEHAREAGFELLDTPKIAWSHTALLMRP